MNTYFDNASTSWPKPPEVYQAVLDCMSKLMGNPGRSSGGSGRLVFDTREAIAALFNIKDSSRIILTFNATHGLNLGIKGLLKTGDRVVTTSMEHNAVVRPLRALKKQNIITFDVVKASREGYVSPDDLAQALKKPTRMVVLNHASNVCGAYNQLEPLGRVTKEAGALFLVDCSQSAGVIDIDVLRDHIDILAGPGHKSLLGPTGTGFCYIAPDLELTPILQGGTGSLSDLECMPDTLPDRFEAGTLNFHGLAGLKAGVEYILKRGISNIFKREHDIIKRVLDGLPGIPGLTLLGPQHAENRLPVFSVVPDGFDPADLANLLMDESGISTRVGLHCAPWAHQTIGSYPAGTVRISPGIFHSDDEIDFMLDALAKAVRKLS